MIDNSLGVTAIGLGITEVSVLTTIVAAPAVNWNVGSINCYGITSSCRKSINEKDFVENRKT